MSGMLTLGFCARSLTAGIVEPEQLLFVMSRQMLPPVLAGLMTAGVLSAIMSTADSQLLVAASSISRDWNLEQSRHHSQVLTASRVVVTLVTLLSCLIALFAPQTIFERVLFAWHGIGSAFAPLLILRVSGCRVRCPNHCWDRKRPAFWDPKRAHRAWGATQNDSSQLARLSPQCLPAAIALAAADSRDCQLVTRSGPGHSAHDAMAA